MDRLPPELLAQVCSLSDIRSLKKIRLVNTTCARIAAQYLFEGLCLSLIPRYLDKVTEVAFHPTLRFHVRTLYFDFDILDEKYADYKTWEMTIDTREPIIAEEIRPKYPETARWQCSQADLDRFHTNFHCLLASQKSLFDGQMDRVVLSVAFAMLPNLRTIESIENTCHDGAVATPYDSIKGYEKNWVATLSDIQRDTLLPDPYLHFSVSSLPGLTRPLASLLSSLGLARKQIRTIELCIPWQFWKQECPSGYERGVQPHICVAFRCLESLDIHLMVDVYELEVALQGLMPLSITNFIGAA